MCLCLPSLGQPCHCHFWLPWPSITARNHQDPIARAFSCWLALSPALKIGQLPSLQFKGSLPSLTSWAEADS